MIKHWAVLTSTNPGEEIVYKGLCGIEGTDKQAYVTDPSRPERVTCDDCKEKMKG